MRTTGSTAAGGGMERELRQPLWKGLGTICRKMSEPQPALPVRAGDACRHAQNRLLQWPQPGVGSDVNNRVGKCTFLSLNGMLHHKEYG